MRYLLLGLFFTLALSLNELDYREVSIAGRRVSWDVTEVPRERGQFLLELDKLTTILVYRP